MPLIPSLEEGLSDKEKEELKKFTTYIRNPFNSDTPAWVMSITGALAVYGVGQARSWMGPFSTLVEMATIGGFCVAAVKQSGLDKNPHVHAVTECLTQNASALFYRLKRMTQESIQSAPAVKKRMS